MGDCNPACVKIILNGGLVAISADLLSKRFPEGDPVQVAAIELRDTARASGDMHEFLANNGALNRKGKFEWDGCDEASEVMAFVQAVGKAGLNADQVTARLNELRDDLLSHMAELVGKKEA